MCYWSIRKRITCARLSKALGPQHATITNSAGAVFAAVNKTTLNRKALPNLRPSRTISALRMAISGHHFDAAFLPCRP
jgi:hypothetical protein